MKSVLVSGAGSAIGGNLVRTLLARGDVKVFATSRSDERLEGLRKALSPEQRASLVAIVGDAGDFSGASALAAQVEKLGGIDCAVAIFGRGVWTSGPLVELAPSEWRAVLDEMLTEHFAFARAMFPVLSRRPGSLYVSLGGGAALQPMPEGGLMSIAAAGQMMMTRVLDRERGSRDPRVVELIVNAGVGPAESHDASRISAADVGRVLEEIVFRGATTWSNATTNGPLVTINATAQPNGNRATS
jgi:NAD(P)-dependent dehydrogenase (short-subunit alcohol dehydrogenase family)